MKLELATKNPAADAVELLHQAAFRSGLGNSLFCAPHKVGSHSPAQLQTFVSKHFTAGRSALLGIGVNHASLAKFGELLNLESGSGPADVASKYGGGEVRTALTTFYKDHFLSPPYPARALHQHLTLLILESIQSSLLSKRCVLAIFSLYNQAINILLIYTTMKRCEQRLVDPWPTWRSLATVLALSPSETAWLPCSCR